MIDPRFERRVSPPDEAGAARAWTEAHRLLAVADHGALALATSIEIHAGPRSAVFRAAVFGLSGRPTVITEHDIPVPERGWELRASGLWVDQVCESPLEHWSYGLEAFGLAIDEPGELLGRGYGERVPVGWELDFSGRPTDAAPVGPRPEAAAGRYVQPGRIDGLLLSAAGEHPIRGPAVRAHGWGLAPRVVVADDDISLAAHLDRPVRGPAVALPSPRDVWWVTPSADELRARTAAVDEPIGRSAPGT